LDCQFLLGLDVVLEICMAMQETQLLSNCLDADAFSTSQADGIEKLKWLDSASK
jgi:hypothetical protein